ncbi:MAG TPA: response regulator [Kofleriaceae bacterium]|jgi:DNA-binding response OmpR family regulator|nr:response regulator [Kofleriaceae bacterium]
MRVLFVEDHRVFAETVASQFLASHHVDIMESVATARLAAAADPPYDVMLIDYDLPDGKGTEVLRHLRAARFRGRIVAVSSKDEGNQELRTAGAHAICKKPELHRIATVLQSLVSR